MHDYRQVFGDKTALGLGLGLERPTIDSKEASQAYREDPAAAFSRIAAQMMTPGASIPVPFANTFADNAA